MSASSADAAADIAHLCDLFLSEDIDAQGWAFLYPDESEWESPDCDIMSRRFLELARREGAHGVVVKVETVDDGPHWFTVVTSSDDRTIAVDWTARQFHNAGYPAPPTDPALIPCPLVFAWPGTYPLPVIEIASESTDEVLSA